MKKILSLFFIATLLTSCKTNIVDHYDCEEKSEMVSKVLIECIKASKEENVNPSVNSIKQNPIYSCEEVTRKLLCKPVYKEFSF